METPETDLDAPNTAAAFFERRAADARPEDLKAFPAAAPDRAPELGDEVPERFSQ